MGKHHSLTQLLPKTFKPPIGQKEVWLPSFTITLLRTTYLPANMACFQVPLNMNKLDIKDYLWNAYEIPVLSVRSYIQQHRVRAGKANDIVLRQGYWTRPKSTKRMIVELGDGEHGGPFVWPEPVKELKDFDKESWDMMQKQQQIEQKRESRRWSRKLEPKDTSALEKQARELLSGTVRWKPSIPIYARDNPSI